MEHHNITAQLNSEDFFIYILVTRKIPRRCCTSQGHTPLPSIPQTPNPACAPQSASLRMRLHPYARHAHRTPPRYNPQRPQAKHARTHIASRGRTTCRAVPRAAEGDRVGGAPRRLVSHPVVSYPRCAFALQRCAVQTESPLQPGSVRRVRRAAAQTYVPWG